MMPGNSCSATLKSLSVAQVHILLRFIPEAGSCARLTMTAHFDKAFGFRSIGS